MALVGWIDAYSAEGIEGWASETASPGRTVAVDFYVNASHTARVLADRHRPDLQAAGYGDGCKAFCHRLPEAVFKNADRVEVKVCFAGTRQSLSNGSFALTAGARPNPWDSDAPYDYSTMWLGAKLCRQYIYRTITGDPELHPVPYVIEKYVLARSTAELRQGRALLLGSSEGYMERELCARGFTGEIIATDIAANALRRAKEQSDALGYHNIKHVVHDVNTDAGAKFGGPFDFIFAEGVLHHIEQIGPCLERCDRLLKEDGYLFALEFEGPFRFQLSELQARWINAALNVLPRGLRPFPEKGDVQYPATDEDNRRVRYVVPPEEAIARMDPSEAVSGPELKRLLPQLFDVVDRKGFGGTLLSYMTCHFDFKRSSSDPYVARWLRVLMEIEHALIDTGILDDEFVFYVLKKKSAAA
jgi:SAM-dependent methyltransferase